ncbi:MAG TPA: dTMP kinase [Solirubrobacteraceae bacterium]|jgi:dTMP kinase|nr:dTMP kinase [Solirubrobacteraceae bacterium]
MGERGRLITIEGVDGAGKTTLAGGLLAALSDAGVDAKLLREPGGVQTSEAVRALVKDARLTVGARAEALLYAAARAQLVEEALEPALAAGEWVLLDRFVDSSLAYQGGGRGLGIEEVRALNLFATGGLAPDRTLLLALDPASAQARADARGEAPDRLELAGAEFFRRIAAAYQQLAAAEPQRIRVLDATLAPDALVDQALGALSDLL